MYIHILGNEGIRGLKRVPHSPHSLRTNICKALSLTSQLETTVRLSLLLILIFDPAAIVRLAVCATLNPKP